MSRWGRGVLLSYRMNGLVGEMPASQKKLELSTVRNGVLLTGLTITEPKTLHGFHTVHTFFYLPKDHMLAIQPFILAVQIKNGTSCVGPAFAMDKMPGPVCFMMRFSSLNSSPKMDLLPVQLWPVKSLPLHMNL